MWVTLFFVRVVLCFVYMVARVSKGFWSVVYLLFVYSACRAIMFLWVLLLLGCVVGFLFVGCIDLYSGLFVETQ